MICSAFYAALLLPLWVITEKLYFYKFIQNDVKIVISGSILLRYVTVHYASTEWSKYSTCMVNPSKYGKENQGIHFHHHHRQAHLIHYFGQEQTPLLMHVIQCRIWVRPGYFINWVRPAWPGQSITRLTWITWMTRPSFNPNYHDTGP